MLEEKPQRFQQQVTEVGRVEFLEPLLIGGIELRALAVAECEGFARRHFIRRQAAVLPAVDVARQLPRRPAVLVQSLGFDHLLQQADLVVGIEDGEAGFQPHELRVPAQDLDADGVERAEPRHGLDRAADEAADALLHLARSLVGEGHGQDLMTLGPSHGHDVGNARREHPGFAGSGTGQNQYRTVESFNGGALLRVEPLEVDRGHAGRSRPRRNRRRRCSARDRTSRLRSGRFGQIERRQITVVLRPAVGQPVQRMLLILRHEIGL